MHWLKNLASPWTVLALLLCWPIIEIGVLVHRTRPAVETSVWQIAWLFDCSRNRACLTSQTAGLIGATRAAAIQSYEASRDARATTREVAAMVREARPHVVAIVTNTAAASAELHETMRQLSAAAGELRAGLTPILTDSDAVARRLDANLESIQRLTDGLDSQIRSGGPIATDDLRKLGQAIDSLNSLASDANVTAAISNTAKATDHFAGAAESVDIALRPWRKRAGMLKTVFEKAVGLIKLTLPIR